MKHIWRKQLGSILVWCQIVFKLCKLFKAVRSICQNWNKIMKIYLFAFLESHRLTLHFYEKWLADKPAWRHQKANFSFLAVNGARKLIDVSCPWSNKTTASRSFSRDNLLEMMSDFQECRKSMSRTKTLQRYSNCLCKSISCQVLYPLIVGKADFNFVIEHVGIYVTLRDLKLGMTINSLIRHKSLR